jgi:hypothetical protein
MLISFAVRSAMVTAHSCAEVLKVVSFQGFGS